MFAIYNQNGRVIRTTTKQTFNLGNPIFGVEYTLEFDDAIKVVPGVSHYVTAGALVPMPPKPSAHHTFDHSAKQWLDSRTPATEWPNVRIKRNDLLRASDWTQLPDSPASAQQKQKWVVYRQALRDITNQADPFTITWPTTPE